MPRLLVTGAGGMLGKEVARQADQRGWEVAALNRAQMDVTSASDVDHWFSTVMPDAVINCAGVIPERSLGMLYSDIIATNTIGPYRLAEAAEVLDTTLIHVSTDCVFDGTAQHERPWWPTDVPNALNDIYGATKALGEPHRRFNKAVTVRTSFIGPEHGLWRWYRRQTGQVEGWSGARWSGSTVDAVATALLDMVTHPPLRNVVHLATSSVSTKAEILQMLHDVLGGPKVVAVAEPRINRVLGGTYTLPPVTRESIERLATRAT